MKKVSLKDLHSTTADIIQSTPVVDFHTHLFTPCHGKVCRWGIDDLLTYHYLVAEVMRNVNLPYEKFWAMPKSAQAELVWKTLFVNQTPVSEACRGVITCLSKLGADPNEKKLETIRKFYRKFTLESFIDKVFSTGGIRHVYMTNDPLDPSERPIWKKGHQSDPRFKTVLRMDSIFRYYPMAREALKDEGIILEKSLSRKNVPVLRKFFDKWCDIIHPEYLAASWPPDFRYPDRNNPYSDYIKDIILPLARERKLPVAFMIGIRFQVNPALQFAGDGVGRSDVTSVENLCRENPDVRFLCTMLSRENQHELCVASRKFRNLMLVGCWWFLNTPSIIEDMTRQRMELLGLSFIPQHSDCRVTDQLLYKWTHSRPIIAKVLSDKYSDLVRSGLHITENQIREDAAALLNGNVTKYLAGATF